MKKIIVIFTVICFSMIYSGCKESASDKGDFRIISGSGYITIQVTGATDHEGKMVWCGASGIEFGSDERAGNNDAIASGGITGIIQDDENENLLFMGGSSIGSVGCVIDENDNSQVDDDDLYAAQRNVIMNGDRTIAFTLGDFTNISGSGYITVEVTGAAAHEGKMAWCGGTGIEFGQNERGDFDGPIGSGGTSISAIFQGDAGNLLFQGGSTVGLVGCTIDGNNNTKMDDGDLYAVQRNITINGNRTETFDIGSFRTISGSGNITIEITGAEDHNGKMFMCGASGIDFGKDERGGDNSTITNGVGILRFPTVMGGTTLDTVGCLIDVNDDDIINDGDLYAVQRNVTVNGDMTITFEVK